MVERILIRPATESDIAALPDIERRAASIFSPEYLPGDLVNTVISPQHHLEAQRNGLLLVAASDGVRPVGFAHSVLHGDCLHLLEIDVDPDFQKLGAGTALLNGVFDLALRQGCEAVTLTTYRDVPWNAPWYASVVSQSSLDMFSHGPQHFHRGSAPLAPAAGRLSPRGSGDAFFPHPFVFCPQELSSVHWDSTLEWALENSMMPISRHF